MQDNIYTSRQDILTDFDRPDIRSTGIGRAFKRYGKQETPEYVEFLQTHQVVLNTCPLQGKLNMRMWEVLGSGAVLLQQKFPEMKELGLKTVCSRHVIEDNREYFDSHPDEEAKALDMNANCLVWENIEQIQEHFDYFADHPDELEEIRLRGIELAKKNTYEKRAEELIEWLEKEVL